MKTVLVFLFLSLPMAAQQISPSQIRPCANGQILQTVSGVTSCAIATGGGIIPAPTGNQNVTQPSGTTLGVNNLNNQATADYFAGSDIGAKINAAYASLGGTSGTPLPSCIVNLLPQQTYSYSTTIIIPNASTSPYCTAPTLNCNGSTLNYTGTTYGVDILQENATGPGTTGFFKNCTIQGSTTDGGAAALIRATSRLGFTYENLVLQNANVCMLWAANTSTGGVGYMEDVVVDGLQTYGCLSHLQLVEGTGATGSFEYNRIRKWHCSLGYSSDNQKCLDAGYIGSTGFDTQGTDLDMTVNTQSSGGQLSMIYLDGTNAVSRGTINLRGENTAGNSTFYTTYINSNGAAFYNEGNVSVNGGGSIGFAAGVNHDNYVLHPSLQAVNNDVSTNSPTIHYEPETGIIAQRHCKTDIGSNNLTPGGNFVMWLSTADSGGGGNDCYFQLLSRTPSNTAGDQEVDIQGAGGAAARNLFYVGANTGNAGFGPGYGPVGSTKSGGTLQPISTMETTGDLGFVYPNYGAAPGVALRSSISTSGSTQGSEVENFYGSSSSGQPSYKRIEVFHDFTTYADVTGMSRFAVNGQVLYNIPYLAGPATAPSGSCPNNGYWTFSQDGHVTICEAGTWTTFGGSGTVTTTGTPATGSLAAFSGSTSITSATTSQVSTLLQTAIGCATAGYVYSPQSNTCIATGSGGSPAFSAITTGTNTLATMTVGNGASIVPSGTGVITPSNVTGLVNADGSTTTRSGAGTSASPYAISAAATTINGTTCTPGGSCTPSGGAPSGTAGGDLGGTYPNPTVQKAYNGGIVFQGPSNYGFALSTSTSNKAFMSTYQDSAIIAVNRDPTNGVYANTLQAAAFIYLNSVAGCSSITFFTSTSNGSTTGDVTSEMNCDGTFTLGAVPALNDSSLHTVSSSWVHQVVVVGTGMYTTATSDTFSIPNLTPSHLCVFSPTNGLAAAGTVGAYTSAVSSGSITISHVATTASGGTVNIMCSLPPSS